MKVQMFKCRKLNSTPSKLIAFVVNDDNQIKIIEANHL